MATPKDFREWASLLSPGSWRAYWGTRFIGGAIGLLFDMLAEGASIAVFVSKMGSRNFPDDSPDLLGIERNMPRFPGEATTSYTQRLKDAWKLWRESGTSGGINKMFFRWLPATSVTFHTNASWDWDSQPTNWSRLWVVLIAHPWTDDGTWDDPGTWDDGGTWDTTATADEVRAARDIVRSFKSGHEICVAICVVLDEVTWNANQPDGTWGDVTNRTPAASYWDG